ncbi:MAG: sugar transferase [Muribaculaceae bacterium]|nr:sugar transferase [Muribaculaceae bacterium]
MSKTSELIKWTFDRSVSIFGLLALSPVLLTIFLAIKGADPSQSAFFRQLRIGQNARPFFILKFRSMKKDSGGSYITLAGDQRLTRIGKFLKKYKLDELPQLWNVAKGEMSFVGPRPDVPGYADLLEGNDRKILELKPGITGPATLKYRNEMELLALQADPLEYNDNVIWPDKIRINKIYADNHSFIGDLKIILQTFHILNSPKDF